MWALAGRRQTRPGGKPSTSAYLPSRRNWHKSLVYMPFDARPYFRIFRLLHLIRLYDKML